MPACPRCKVDLFFGSTSTVSMHACGRCGGVWLDKNSARTVREALPEDAIKLAASASSYGQNTDTRSPVLCPVCHQGTQRVKTATGIEIDECNQHGTWFDRGELELIASALKAKRSAKPPTGNAGPAAKGSAGPAGKQPPPAPPPGYAGHPGVSKTALAAGAVGVAGVAGAAALISSQQQQQQQGTDWGEAVETGLDVLDTGLDLADSGVVDLAADGLSAAGEAASALMDSGAAEAVAEGAGSILEGVFSLFGALFD